MCWSEAADLRAGVVLLGLSVVSVGMVRKKRHLLLALTPMLLAVHQLLESQVWATLHDGRADNMWTLFWGLVAAPTLAFFGPVAVLVAFPHRWKYLLPSLVGGCAVALTSIIYCCAVGVTATQNHHVLDYDLHTPHIGWLIAVYQLATWGSLILSGNKYVRQTGVGIGLAGAIAAAIDYKAYFSVWCAFGAIVIVLNLRWLRHEKLAEQAVLAVTNEPRSMQPA
jgi:hypothetical protein